MPPFVIGRRAVWALGFGALALALLAGCTRQHRAGRKRVVSLAPSTTEAMFAIGAGALLVGRSSYCDFPEAAKALPSVGGYADPDFERVLALAPTLVISDQGPGKSIEAGLRAHGIETYFAPARSLADIGAMIAGLGERVGRSDEARRVRAGIDADVARIAAWAAGLPRVRAVMVLGARPLFVAGPGSFADELIAKAGGRNAIEQGGAYPTIDIERLLALDPDAVIDATDGEPGASRLPDSEGWAPLRATREHRVVKLVGATALRPGPRIAQGLRTLARALHGKEPPETPP